MKKIIMYSMICMSFYHMYIATIFDLRFTIMAFAFPLPVSPLMFNLNLADF